MAVAMFKEGDFVAKVLRTGPYRTVTIQQIDGIDDEEVCIEDLSSRWDLYTGREIDPVIPGCDSQLIPLDGGEVERWDFAGTVREGR